MEGARGWWAKLARKTAKILLVALGILAAALITAWWMMIRMPGSSHQGPLPKLTPAEQALAEGLRRDVEALAGAIGERHLDLPEKLEAAAKFIESSLAAEGLTVKRLPFAAEEQTATNLEVEWPGSATPDEVVVVGAHYDSAPGTPGADDNASGVAGLLALARGMKGQHPGRTLRLVAFANEEPPYFQKEGMGSLAYAKACQARGNRVVAMVSLEMVGAYQDLEGSQQYPPPLSWFYPSRGDFLALVGNFDSRRLVHRTLSAFRRLAPFPSEGAALPGALPGIGWSDHWSFWQIDVPAIMATDTAFFRNPRYHAASDTPDTLDYGRMARVVTGLQGMIAELTDGE